MYFLQIHLCDLNPNPESKKKKICEDDSNEEVKTLLFHFGMSGSFQFTPGNDAPRFSFIQLLIMAFLCQHENTQKLCWRLKCHFLVTNIDQFVACKGAFVGVRSKCLFHVNLFDIYFVKNGLSSTTFLLSNKLEFVQNG